MASDKMIFIASYKHTYKGMRTIEVDKWMLKVESGHVDVKAEGGQVEVKAEHRYLNKVCPNLSHKHS